MHSDSSYKTQAQLNYKDNCCLARIDDQVPLNAHVSSAGDKRRNYMADKRRRRALLITSFDAKPKEGEPGTEADDATDANKGGGEHRGPRPQIDQEAAEEGSKTAGGWMARYGYLSTTWGTSVSARP